MRIAVLADTHIPASSSRLPDSLIKQIKGVDLIVHAGDLTELSVLEELNKIAKTEAVSGNMDSHRVRRALPDKKILELSKFRIGLIHGWGPPNNVINYIRADFSGERLDCIIYGHTHRPSIDDIDNTIYFNPGSPTDRIFAPYNSFGILEIDDKLTPRIIRL